MRQGEKRYFSYVKGLNTEAGPLTFPENTWADGDNLTPKIDGSVRKRLAVDLEDGYVLSSAFSTSLTMADAEASLNAFVLDEWTSAGGSGSVNITVMQAGTTLLFFYNTGDAQTSNYISSYTLTPVSGNTSTPGTSPIQCSSAHGKLLLVSGDTDPLLFTYDDGTISAETITLYIRDLYGVDDGLAVDNKPSTLSTAHNYNLLNQGWDSTKITTYYSSGSTYPSNAQIWTAGKDSSDNFSASQLNKIDFGTSPAPKGRFVLPLFNRNRDTASGLTGITTETESYRPSTVAFWAGRAWYAGVRSSTISNWIVFSQVSDTAETFGNCYQSADPTSEQISDLVATDGGVIPIQEAGTIVRIFPYQKKLLVLADNGVWSISAGDSTVFSATSYSVDKVSNIGCVAPRSVVETEKGIAYWGVSGIYFLKPNDVSASNTDTENVTATTIQTFYNDILENNKPYASGKYYQKEKTIYWVYDKDTEKSASVDRFKFKDVLCLDMRLGAFFTYSIGELDTDSPYVFDLVISKTKSEELTTFNVQDSSNNDVLSSTSTVVVDNSDTLYTTSVVKFGVVYPSSGNNYVTMGEFSTAEVTPTKFMDWYSVDTVGVGYTTYLLTGYDLGPQGFGGSRNLGAIYVTVLMRRTETGVDEDGNAINPSSCTLNARWDWADSSASGKWSTGYEVYKHRRVFLSNTSATYDDGMPVVVTKNKVRGRGRALQLYFLADEEKDMQLLGWQVPYFGDNIS